MQNSHGSSSMLPPATPSYHMHPVYEYGHNTFDPDATQDGLQMQYTYIIHKNNYKIIIWLDTVC